jgi:hypothetical protein
VHTICLPNAKVLGVFPQSLAAAQQREEEEEEEVTVERRGRRRGASESAENPLQPLEIS